MGWRVSQLEVRLKMKYICLERPLIDVYICDVGNRNGIWLDIYMYNLICAHDQTSSHLMGGLEIQNLLLCMTNTIIWSKAKISRHVHCFIVSSHQQIHVEHSMYKSKQNQKIKIWFKSLSPLFITVVIVLFLVCESREEIPIYRAH